MECMICFGVNEMYSLKGCNHSICILCADKMKDKKSIKHPFSHTFTMIINEGVKCIKCPYCRQVEPANFDMTSLIKKHKKDYHFWIELELNFDGEKSIARDITQVYSLGKKRMKCDYFIAMKGATFARFYDDTSSRYRKMPFSKKDQWSQIAIRH